MIHGSKKTKFYSTVSHFLYSRELAEGNNDTDDHLFRHVSPGDAAERFVRQLLPWIKSTMKTTNTKRRYELWNRKSQLRNLRIHIMSEVLASFFL